MKLKSTKSGGNAKYSVVMLALAGLLAIGLVDAESGGTPSVADLKRTIAYDLDASNSAAIGAGQGQR